MWPETINLGYIGCQRATLSIGHRTGNTKSDTGYLSERVFFVSAAKTELK